MGADSKTDIDILDEAKELFKESDDGTNVNRLLAESDLRFGRLGEQWEAEVKDKRHAEGRPCLTINKLPSFIRQVVNDARQNKPGVIVSPVDNGADVKTANIINGIIRSIQRNSCADVAFDTALDNAVSCGFGFFKVGIEYAHERSFDMELRIKRIANPLSVHWDINSTEFDASDWNYAFISDWYAIEDFEKNWPGANKSDFDSNSLGGSTNLWHGEDGVRVSEYWRRTEHPDRLLLLSDGSVIREKALTVERRMWNLVNGVNVVRERDTKIGKVTRRIISGSEVLEEEEWPGSTIPICPVWGEEVVVDNYRWFRSMIRDARDPQQMINFWRSAEAEIVALAPKAPYMVEEGSIPVKERDKWNTLNTRSWPYLSYAKGSNPPRREMYSGIPAGALQESLNMSDDMKAIIGIYDASLGARSNETSGRAIMARQKQGDSANFHFVDNLSRAIQYMGKILVEVIPHVYKGRQAIRILGEDESEDVINLSTQDQEAVEPDENGEGGLYNLGVGRYDVAVKAGPNYQSKREETREVLIEIMRQVPGAAELIGDILMRHMDFEGADEVEKRLKMMLQAKGINLDSQIAMPQQNPMGMPQPMQGSGVPAQTGSPMPMQGMGVPQQ